MVNKTMTQNDKIDDFIGFFAKSLEDGSFVKATLGHYTGDEAELKTILIRKAIIKREEKLAFTYRYKTRDIAKNYSLDEGINLIKDNLEEAFQAANLFTAAFNLTLQSGKLKSTPATITESPDPSHDRAKKRMVETEGKHYLHSLKITDENGAVYKNAQDKFRQINKYIEILDKLIAELPQDNLLHIVDMGSGKGYLTFALYDYLTNNLNRNCIIRGVEYRQDMVDLCNGIAQSSGFDGLSFTQGTIEDFETDKLDILIALHACDTATDDAIAKGVHAGAGLIVVAPCCHKQIRREMEKGKAPEELGFLLRHGTFMERQAEMATDAMRSLLLESEGYNTKAFEFISDAHTPKNVMITAIKGKKSAEQKKSAQAGFDAAKKFLGIDNHYLEKALGR